MHTQTSSYAGKTLRIRKGARHFQFKDFGGRTFRVEDWWDRVSPGSSWKNPVVIAEIIYSKRQEINTLPADDQVLYGKTEDGLGHLVHVTELEEIK